MSRLKLSPSSHSSATGTLIAHGAEEHLRARGVNLRFVFRSDESATVQGLVASGFAAAIVPRLTVNFDDRGIRALDVGQLIPPRTIVIAYHRDRYRSPAASAFQAMAHDVCAELSKPRRLSRRSPSVGPT